VDEGDVLSYGGYDFEAISTPGHTPGQMCLYDAKSRVMILGDHVLFDITPNIVSWETMEDSLGTYLESLRKIAAYDVEVPPRPPDHARHDGARAGPAAYGAP
jgi:glyoxylase-like metal-dependent hydrolase (beta-lactamase superfamily II)